jgi:AcrR family transcriptional regulator
MGTRQVPRAVREAEMLAVGRRMFAERDYRDVSMDELAGLADVSKPMVYAYFDSKEGLYLACVEDATRELVAKLEQAIPAELPASERLWRGLIATFEFIEESRETWEMLHPSVPGGSALFAAGAARANAAMTDVVTQLLRDAAVAEGIDAEVAREGTEPLAHALVAAVQAVATRWLRHPEEPKERQALRLMNFFWMGLENLLHGRLWLPTALEGDTHDPVVARRGLAERLETNRVALLDEVFTRTAAAFDPESGVSAVVEWRVGGRPRGGHDRFQLRLGPGGCEVRRAGRARADLTITIRAEDLVALVSGQTTGTALFTFGKMKVEGDMLLAARLPGLFRRRRPD